MSEIDKMHQWLKGFAQIPADFQVDYTHEVPGMAGLFPQGIQEVRRQSNIVGDTKVTNQLNFALYSVLNKPENYSQQAETNANWVMDLQRWGQEQSVKGLAPKFGNCDEHLETIKIQNGALHALPDGGVAIYCVAISVLYTLFYEGE